MISKKKPLYPLEVEIKLELNKSTTTFQGLSHVSLTKLDLPTPLPSLLADNPPITFSYERDDYYDHPALSLADNDLVLRNRRSRTWRKDDDHWQSYGQESFLTWKGAKHGGDFKTRSEREFVVRDDIWAVLKEMGFSSPVTVEKYRWSADLSDRWPGLHLTVDAVEGLGLYAEVEIVAADTTELDDVNKKLSEALKELKLEPFPVEKRSYACMIAEVK